MSDLRQIAARQRETLEKLLAEVKNIEGSDLVKENNRLKSELEKTQDELSNADMRLKIAEDENTRLRNALYEQIYNEKVNIVSSTTYKLDVYFKSSYDAEVNRLTDLERRVTSKIDFMMGSLKQNCVDASDEIYSELERLSALLNRKITTARETLARNSGAFSENERSEFDSLKAEQITGEQMLLVTKKNNLERFLGLNILNGLGILLIIIGVITAARYTYVALAPELKGTMMFALGIIMLIGGEFLNRRKANIFSLGITAGGIGVLYTSLALSYFGLRILHIYPALALCVLVTAAAFFLSTRYNSQTILTFALVGGYLPMASIGNGKMMIYAGMVYFVVLNLLAFLVAFRKKWSVASFIGLFLNIAGTLYICTRFSLGSQLYDKIIVITYVLFAFLNYTLIPIVGSFRNNQRFKRSDVVLLAINTFFSSLTMYLVFYDFNFEDYTGMLALAFAAVYLLLGRLIEKRLTEEKNAQALFYLTGLAFVVLVIPFQFGKVWLSLGWLAEGVALTAYGILKEEKAFKRTGLLISCLCLGAFLFFDLYIGIDRLFAWKYLALTLGSLVILGAYMFKKTLASGFQRGYKYAATVNLWIYALYICNKLDHLLRLEAYNTHYLAMALAVVLTFSIAYAILRIKLLCDVGIKTIGSALYVIGTVWLFFINSNNYPYYGTPTSNIMIISTIVLIIICLIAVFAVRDLVKLLVMERKIGVEWYPLVVSAYFVVLLTQNLITQYHLSFASVWISIIFAITALAWIVFGFVRRYSYIRRFGLGLSMLAVVKLFIVDMWSLTLGYKIISYFVLGVTLIGISFVYQYFSKRLELQMEDVSDVQENN